jgi:chorismate dehydratase
VLLKEQWRVEPAAFVTRDEPHDGLLLIGDEALRRRHGVPGLPHVYDLGRVWFDRTGLPFVYAHWVARRDADEAELIAFERTLGESLERGFAAIDGFAGEYTEQTGLTTEGVAAYLAGFAYRMGDAEREALAAFRRCYDALPLWRPDGPEGAGAARSARLTGASPAARTADGGQE